MQDVTSSEFGRVAEDGTVYVRVGADELAVGQYPAESPEEALAFFTRRYDRVALEVQLVERRVHSGSSSPEEMAASIDTVHQMLAEPNFVGDVVGLRARLEALRPLVAQRRAQRQEHKAQRVEEARTRKQEIAAEAEAVAAQRNWRTGADRLRELLTEWKALPRLDRRTDEELWHRFSSARTSYTKARKAHFAELGERREQAAAVKERLIRRAEELSGSTDWGPTSTAYGDLMREWKAAGSAPRNVEEKLWKRFRAAQDVFFSARDAANAELDREYAANAETKRAILAEAEALLPVDDLPAAKRRYRELAERWEGAGKVPRDQMRELEGRMRKVEQTLRDAEDHQWRRSDPEKSARAEGMVAQLQAAIDQLQADLARAEDSGDEQRVRRLRADLDSRRQFLEVTRRVSADYRG